MIRFKIKQFPEQFVVFNITDHRCVQDVVIVVMETYLGPQFLDSH